MSKEKKYEFIVDTDSYSGNFERDLLLYVCGAGTEYSMLELEKLAAKELTEKQLVWFEDNLRYDGEYDDACEVRHPQNNYQLKPNSVAILLSKKPTKNILELMVARSKKFCEEGMAKWEPKPNFISARLIEITQTIIETELEKFI